MKGATVYICAIGLVWTGIVTPGSADPDVAGGASRPKTGLVVATFTRRCKASTAAVMARRMGWPQSKLTPYAVTNTTFNVWVPDAYDASGAFGLFVYVSPTPSAAPPAAFLPALRQHRLIYASANNSGNDRRPHVRIGLALDAAFNMVQRYNIDRDRIFIGGVSGGGRISSMAALAYPDIFKGCLAIVGVNYFRPIPVPDMPGRNYPAIMRAPLAPYFDQARGESCFVLVTGSRDANRDNTWATYRDGFVKDGFRHVHYHEVEDMGHTIPAADVLTMAIGWMK